MASNASDVAAQARTLARATRKGTHYTQSELDRIKDSTAAGQTAEQIAGQLNRSLYAIRMARKVAEERRERATPARKGGTVLDSVGYTDIEALFA